MYVMGSVFTMGYRRGARGALGIGGPPGTSFPGAEGEDRQNYRVCLRVVLILSVHYVIPGGGLGGRWGSVDLRGFF